MFISTKKGHLWSPVSIGKPAPKIHHWTIYFCRWGFGWVDKAQCFRSARRFGAAGSSLDFSRIFYGMTLLGRCLENFFPQNWLPVAVRLCGNRLGILGDKTWLKTYSWPSSHTDLKPGKARPIPFLQMKVTCTAIRLHKSIPADFLTQTFGLISVSEQFDVRRRV